MTYCVVKECHNATHKKNKDNKITFHTFPSNPIAAARWIEKIRLNRREECWKPTKCTLICSEHFNDKEKYTTKGGYCKLRQDAVPTKGLHIFCKEENQNSNNDLYDPHNLDKTQLGTSSNKGNESNSKINEAEGSGDPGLHIFCKEENQNSNDDLYDPHNLDKTQLGTSSNKGNESNLKINEVQGSGEPGLHIFCKEENQNNNDDLYDPLNLDKTQLGTSNKSNESNSKLNEAQGSGEPGLHIFCKEENQNRNDDLYDPHNLDKTQLDTSNKGNESNPKINEVQGSGEPISQECDPALDYIFDTPLEYALRKQLAKKTLLQRKHAKKIKLLQQKVRRLNKKNMYLRKKLITFKNKRFVDNNVSYVD